MKFKPIKNEKVVISIRINQDKLDIIDNISKSIDISRNELIVQCIDYAISNSDFNKNNNDKK